MNTKNDSDRLIDADMPELVSTLVKKQLDVLAAGSELSRQRKRVGDLKKERDGIIAEITRSEISLRDMPLPLGLTTNDAGYVIADDADDEGDEE